MLVSDELEPLQAKVATAKSACQLNMRVYKYLTDESADLSKIEEDVALAHTQKMKFSQSVMTRLLVWMCEARMRVNDYDKQAEYFSSTAVTIFGLEEETATLVCLNALEGTLSRLITVLTPAMLEADSAEVTTLRLCLKSYSAQGDSTFLFLCIVHELLAMVFCVSRVSLRLCVAFAFV